jgi:hypothetical protein
MYRRSITVLEHQQHCSTSFMAAASVQTRGILLHTTLAPAPAPAQQPAAASMLLLLLLLLPPPPPPAPAPLTSSLGRLHSPSGRLVSWLPLRSRSRSCCHAATPSSSSAICKAAPCVWHQAVFDGGWVAPCGRCMAVPLCACGSNKLPALLGLHACRAARDWHSV